MPNKPIVVLNSGSSSIKFSLFHASEHDRTKLFEGAVDGIGTDRGKFWIKDAEGKKLATKHPRCRRAMLHSNSLRTLSASLHFPILLPSDIAWSPVVRTVTDPPAHHA